MNPTATTVRRSLAPLALMGLIFFLSAQTDLDSGLGVLDYIGRKLVHALVYGALTLGWYWALRPTVGRPLLWAALIAFLYAVSDEYHQSFVEGRSGSPLDVGFDLIGVIGALLLLRYDRRVRSVLDGEEP